MSERLSDVVKLADVVNRVITIRANVKTPGGTKERLYRVTLPTGTLKRDTAMFEAFRSKSNRSHKAWHIMPLYGTTANELWSIILENEEIANV